jgi:hypothetical protein
MITMSARFTWKRTMYSVAIAGPVPRMELKQAEVERRLKETARQLEMADDG